MTATCWLDDLMTAKALLDDLMTAKALLGVLMTAKALLGVRLTAKALLDVPRRGSAESTARDYGPKPLEVLPAWVAPFAAGAHTPPRPTNRNACWLR